MFGNLVDDVINTGKSHMSGGVGAARDYVYSSANNLVDDFADNLIDSVGGQQVSGAIYYQQAKQAARQFMTTPFIQGWQWCIEADHAPFDFDIYVKDVDFGAGSIDADVFQIGAGSIAVPTFSSAGEVSLTVRDHGDLRVCKWFDKQMAKVKNKDGTLNLPKDYVFNLKVYTISEFGTKTLLSSMQVFALKKGNFALSREGANTFLSVPLTFQKFSTIGDKRLTGVAGGTAVDQLLDDAIDTATDFIDGIF